MAFVATAAPEGWALGRWLQKSETTWEEQKLEGSQDRFQFEVLAGPRTPGSTTIRLRRADGSAEVLLVGDSVQVFASGHYLGEYIGHWEGGRPPPPPLAPPPLVPAPTCPVSTPEDAEAKMLQSAPPLPTLGASQTSAAPPLGRPGEGLPRPVTPNKAGDLDSSPETARKLVLAAGQGDLATVRSLLFDTRADPDAGADAVIGGPALFPAAEGGHLQVVEALLEAGADVNLARDGAVPAGAAFRNGHEAVVRALMGAAFVALSSTLRSQGPGPTMASSILRGISSSCEDGQIMPEMVEELHVITKHLMQASKVADPEPPSARRPSKSSEVWGVRQQMVVEKIRAMTGLPPLPVEGAETAAAALPVA